MLQKMLQKMLQNIYADIEQVLALLAKLEDPPNECYQKNVFKT